MRIEKLMVCHPMLKVVHTYPIDKHHAPAIVLSAAKQAIDREIQPYLLWRIGARLMIAKIHWVWVYQ